MEKPEFIRAVFEKEVFPAIRHVITAEDKEFDVDEFNFLKDHLKEIEDARKRCLKRLENKERCDPKDERFMWRPYLINIHDKWGG